MATFENTDVHFSILPHLDALPELGDEWHVDDRRKWLESLDATLAALYPIPGAAQETRPVPDDRWIKHEQDTSVPHCCHEWRLISGSMSSAGYHYVDRCAKCDERRERRTPLEPGDTTFLEQG